MKISNEVQEELKKIRASMADAHSKLTVVLYEKQTAAKTSYHEVNPFDLVQNNFQYITDKIRNMENSDIVED